MPDVVQLLSSAGLSLEPVQPFPIEVLVSSPINPQLAMELLDQLDGESRQVVAMDLDAVLEWLDELGKETLQWMANEAAKLEKELVDDAAVTFFRERQRVVFGSDNSDYLHTLGEQMRGLESLSTDPELPDQEPQPEWVDHNLPVQLVALDCAPHLVPLYLCFGGFNRCPFPEEHAAVLGYWGRRYGARVIHLGRNTLDLELSQPPRLRRELRRAVWAYFLHSGLELYRKEPTLVDQVDERVRRRWFCWWD